MIPVTILVMRATIMVAKFSLTIFISRYLDLEALGRYGLIAGAVAVIPTVVGMGMVHFIMRDAVTLSPMQLTDSLRHYWCFIVPVYIFLLLVAVPLGHYIDAPALLAFSVAIALLEHVGNDIYHLFSNLQRPLLANATAFIRGAGWMLIYVPFAIWFPALRSLPVMLAGWLSGDVLMLSLFVFQTRTWPWKNAFAIPFTLAHTKLTIRCAFVLYNSDLSFIIGQYLDRYLVNFYLGMKIAGIYFFYWSIANAVSTFVTMAVIQIQRPLLIKAHDAGDPSYHSLSARYLQETSLATILVSITVGGGFQFFIPFLHQPLIADYIPAFWLILAGMAMRTISDFGGMVLFTARRDRLMTLTNVASAFTLVILQVAVLPHTGLYGVGTTIIVTSAIIGFWRYIVLFIRPWR